jgi:hypothetical protein
LINIPSGPNITGTATFLFDTYWSIFFIERRVFEVLFDAKIECLCGQNTKLQAFQLNNTFLDNMVELVD